MPRRQSPSPLTEISGVVALRHIALASSTTVKVCWFSILALSVSLCSTMIFQLLYDYMVKPIISVQDLQTLDSLEFPRITLCLYLRANNSLVKHHNYTSKQMAFMFSTFDGLYDSYPNYTEHELNILEESLKPESEDLKTFFLETVGISCRDVLKSCSFQGFFFDCCQDSHLHLSSVGLCMTLLPPQRYQTIPGKRGSLKITFMMFEESVPNTYFYSYPHEGVALHIAPPTTAQNLTGNPMLLSSKRYMMVQLVKRVTNLYKPNGNCVDDKQLKYYDVYSQNACVDECIANATVDICGCALIGSVNSEMFSNLCKPVKAITCAHLARQDLVGKFSVRNCSCMLPCTYTDYQSDKVPATNYLEAKNLELNLNPDWVDNRYDTAATVEIYFRDFMFWTTQLRPRFSIPEFISLLGSQLSLWVGIRIVTVIEVVYVFIKLIHGRSLQPEPESFDAEKTDERNSEHWKKKYVKKF